MTPETLGITTGSILSLLFNYIPGLKDWFDSFSAKAQKLAMAVMTLVAAIGITVWSCSDPNNAKSGIGVCLSGVDWRSILITWFLTLGPNQVIDRVSPKAGDGK